MDLVNMIFLCISQNFQFLAKWVRLTKNVCAYLNISLNPSKHIFFFLNWTYPFLTPWRWRVGKHDFHVVLDIYSIPSENIIITLPSSHPTYSGVAKYGFPFWSLTIDAVPRKNVLVNWPNYSFSMRSGGWQTEVLCADLTYHAPPIKSNF